MFSNRIVRIGAMPLVLVAGVSVVLLLFASEAMTQMGPPDGGPLGNVVQGSGTPGHIARFETVHGITDSVIFEVVGLLLVNEAGDVHVQQEARNPALVVTPAPGLGLGPYRNAVDEALNKFNGVDRKDGLRDMCEIVESLTGEVTAIAARRGLMTMDEATARTRDWSTQINALASSNVCVGDPIIDLPLKDDLHSFRNGRNLVDHAITGRRERTHGARDNTRIK